VLNYTKKYIYFVALSITTFILLAFVVIDISRLPRQRKHKDTEKSENCIAIENAYMELSRNYQSRFAKKLEEKKKEKKVEKLENINFYSTNPWRVKIPSLRIDAPIAEGTSQEALRRTVGHFEQTDKWKGNVALAGHNRGYRCNFFQEIKQLKKGDLIIYSTKKGERKYRVIVNTVIKETDWSYIENTKDNRITLITCETNRKEYRRCIQAVEIKNRSR